MSDMIERSLDLSDEITRALPERGDLRAIEIAVPDGFDPTPITGLNLPPSTIVVSITRDGRVAVPDGSTEVMADDRLLFVTHTESIESLNRMFAQHLGTTES
ncbi:MAG: TrkA C-terminal domain-containing protein [Acidimicrobiia bacterium]